jgi:ABC-type phosphate/phosphonate transport system substrate-binding protein
MIASLPMYDRPETQGANDRLWALIRDNLFCDKRPVPQALTRDGDPWEQWTSPDLILSQTCGLPYRAKLHPKVAMVGTPVLDLTCAPGYYYSVVVVRADDTRAAFDDFKGACLAVNDPLSQSGWAAAASFAKEHGFEFDRVLLTGAHVASADAVLKGRADLAAIDAVTWSLIERFDAVAQSLRVLTTTPPTPALPYITAQGHDTDELFNAIGTAIDQLSTEDRALLCLKGLTAIPSDRYLDVETPRFPA